jgi:hypothetical protein
MRCQYVMTTAVLVFLVLFANAGPRAETGTGSAVGADGTPVAAVLQADYVFPVVVDGAQVKHDFTVENRGTADLSITKVKTG